MLRLNCLKQHVCPYCYGLDACPVSPRQLQILLITLSNYSTWLRCTTEWKRYVRDFAMASRSAFHASCTQSLQHHISKLLQVKCVIFFWDTAYKPIWSKFAFPLKFQSALWLLHRITTTNVATKKGLTDFDEILHGDIYCHSISWLQFKQIKKSTMADGRYVENQKVDFDEILLSDIYWSSRPQKLSTYLNFLKLKTTNSHHFEKS